MYKFTMIISQYYHSRHFFIVKHDESDFIEKARLFAAELIAYKRDPDSKRELWLGDLDPDYVGDKIKRRYNINDTGDIYFDQSYFANYLMSISWEYQEASRRESKGFQSKKVTDSISEHHDYERVKELVEKYFEIT